MADAVFERLADDIVSGDLAPGEVLRDHDLAEALGVSRTPVREALRRLAMLGLVDTVANRYTRVSSVDEQTILDTLEYTGHQAGVALRMAVPRLTDAEQTEAVSLLDAMIAANGSGDPEALYAASFAFVGFMTARTGNSVFEAVMAEVGLMVRRNLRERRPEIGTPEERDGHYREMRAAVIARDGERADAAFRAQHHL